MRVCAASRRPSTSWCSGATGNGENQGFVAIRTLTRPKATQANREDGIAADPVQRYCTASSGKPAPFQEKSPPGKR